MLHAPPGPDSVTGLVGWHYALAKKLVAKTDPAALAVKLSKVILTSEFSGMGSAEIALRMVMDGLAHAGIRIKGHLHFLWGRCISWFGEFGVGVRVSFNLQFVTYAQCPEACHLVMTMKYVFCMLPTKSPRASVSCAPTHIRQCTFMMTSMGVFHGGPFKIWRQQRNGPMASYSMLLPMIKQS